MREYINLKAVVNLNCKEADGLVCEYCKEPILLIPSRRNRIDCENSNEKLVCYHIWCYDMVLLDKVTAHTRSIMDELLKEFDSI